MAEVFEGELASELGFVRKVAIKRMLAEVAGDPDTAKRFLDEARIASRLHHASIVAVLDVGLLEGLPFQVLELVDGINVEQLMQRAGGTLPIDIALFIANEVAHALDHAHAATDDAGAPLGIVHRDVKPSNILVAWGGDVKLSDFGIAVARGRESRTEAGTVTGTLGYMSPEQRTRSHVDDRSDVYALGLTLHAMIAGDSPLRDAAAELRAASGQRLELDARVPDDVRRVIDSALAPDRLARPSAHQLADAIGSVLAPRMVRDGRTALRDFLATLRDAGPKRGALDQLLGLDMVVDEAAPPAPGPPRFELRPTGVVTVPSRPRPRKRRGIGLALAVMLAAAASIGVWRAHRDDDAVVPALADAHVTIVVAVPVDAQPIVVPDDAQVVAPDASVHAVRVRHPDAAIADPGTGYVQVIGDDLIGSKVYADGVVVGYPPGKIKLARGHHQIVVEKPDGTRLPAQAVDITDLDTLAHPLRLHW
jgi:protein kinase-like protein